MSDHSGNVESDRLDAMLYVLGDPALNRGDFERRLENDSALAQLVADSVELVGQIKPAFRAGAIPSPSSQRTAVYFLVKTAWLAAIAASLVIVISYWQTIRSTSLGSTNVAQAWSDLKLAPSESHFEDAILTPAAFVESDVTQDDDVDLPDWLILAAAPSNDQMEVVQ